MKYLPLALLAFCLTAEAKFPRSQAAKVAFVKTHPCPAPGPHHGTSCAGYVIDHKRGLCVGGSDTPRNMQWMAVASAKAKDRWECKPGWESKLKASKG